MGHAEAIVRFCNVQKTYDGETQVVKNLNLDIARGEFLTLLGPSGSGKSTCLMMLAGFESPTHGDIWLDGQRLNAIPPYKRNIGMIFQNYALFPHMTVAENLAFPLSIRKLGKAEISSKVKRALDMVQLSHLANRYPNQLSGGQQQRVACARALVFEPQLVLLDEPLGALDKNLRESMQLEIKHIHENLGVTMVFVTHDQSEALTMSDRIAVFNDGVIQQLDSPDRLYDHPANEFVARFIGETNLLQAQLHHHQGHWCEADLGNGQSLMARAQPGLKPGSSVALSIRPERILLNHQSADLQHQESGWNRLSGTLKESIYLGDHLRLTLDLGAELELMVKVAARPGERLNLGSQLSLAFHAEDCRALPH
ncbi:ABC transporter ATP-binding protein [Balneatrix alpica]|uniref:ABC transporter ATP-binding protein n=1 Tax=Balneatrix alpica TaxID=75684 RepID=UPI002738D83D|nr:ABC transporter ATP-binding protein [Balneatrix alpica]